MPQDPLDPLTDRARLVHKEIIQLLFLMALAAGAFVLTRSLASSTRTMSARDAAEWHARGQQEMRAGHVEPAIEAFRRATVKERGNKTYALALANALAAARQGEAARSALLVLRESSPEDADINVELARLAAARQDVTEAVRYYDSALYAPWPGGQADARRRFRVELIRFLLAHQQTSRALSELVAASADLPDTLAAHLEIAHLFAQAGDYSNALDHFTRALRVDTDDADARAGAGEAAFNLGNYALARRYLRGLRAAADSVKEMQQIAELIISTDPLADRLSEAERQRRLREDFDYASRRLTVCAGQQPGAAASANYAALQREADAFTPRLRPPAIRKSATLDAGIDVVYRIARETAANCQPATTTDRALVLIGRRHGADNR